MPNANPAEVLLCGCGCQSCPTAAFAEDGSCTLSEFGQSVKLSSVQLGMLIAEASRRGCKDPNQTPTP